MRSKWIMLSTIVPAVLVTFGLFVERARGTPALVDSTGWGCSGSSSSACRTCCLAEARSVRVSCSHYGGTIEFCNEQFEDAFYDCKREECMHAR